MKAKKDSSIRDELLPSYREVMKDWFDESQDRESDEDNNPQEGD